MCGLVVETKKKTENQKKPREQTRQPCVASAPVQLKKKEERDPQDDPLVELGGTTLAPHEEKKRDAMTHLMELKIQPIQLLTRGYPGGQTRTRPANSRVA